MADVKILISGYHEHEGNKLKICSTVTLIKSDKNILVDTGGFGIEKELKEKLAEEKLKFEDIDIIFITHLHLDHLCNIYLFPNAVIYCKLNGGEYPGQRNFPKEKSLERFELKDGTKIAKDVSVIELPGHSSDLLGLVIETSIGKIVIASDAIASEKNVQMEIKPPKMLLSNEKQYDSSRKKILEIADYIVPGHGAMFKVQK